MDDVAVLILTKLVLADTDPNDITIMLIDNDGEEHDVTIPTMMLAMGTHVAVIGEIGLN